MRYPMQLSLSSLTVKTVHNSYGVDKRTVTEQLTWNPARPYRGGCCGVELDVVQDTDTFRWSVQHGHDYSSASSKQLARYLNELDAWSAELNNDHPPVFIHFDLKNAPASHASFAIEFDTHVLEAMPNSRFLTPGDLLDGFPTLLDAALAGWPSLEQAWGRFICCLSGQQHERTAHYIASPSARLCFADRDVSTIGSMPIDPRAEPNRVIYNFRYDRLPGLSRLIAREYRHALIFRVYEVNDEDTWRLARRLGVNLIATDQVFVTKWAVASEDCPLCPVPSLSAPFGA